MTALKVKKKIKRRPGTKSKNYFTKDTDEAIKEWQNCDDPVKQELVYKTRVAPAFEALATNLMWVYNFKIPRESPDAVKQDCVAFLYEKMGKWDPDRGIPAFSYYNITAKRWLINRSKKALKESNRQIGINDKSEMSPWDWRQVEEYSVSEDPSEMISSEDTEVIFSRLLEELDECAKNSIDVKVADGIRYLFENVESIDIVNKRSILIYLREITGLTSAEVSTGLHTLRKRYRGLTGGRGIFANEFWED